MIQQMPQQLMTDPGFIDRRNGDRDTAGCGAASIGERRQFRDGQRHARPDVAELAVAVDDYKISHYRRFITFEELLDVMLSLGYHK